MGVATAIAIGSLAATAATTTASFVQAGQQRKLQVQAQQAANQAMEDARKKLEKNYYDELAIQKEPYELQREALISAGAQQIQAGVESERGAAATAGRVQMAQNEAQAGIRSDMGREMQQLEQLTAQEQSRLRDVGVQLDLGEVEGAQLAAANAQELAAQATQQGMQGVTSLGQQVYSYIPLFEKSASAKQFSQLQSDYAKAAESGKLASQFLKNGIAVPLKEAIEIIGKQTPPSAYGFDISGIGAMAPDAFQDYMTKQPSQNLKMLKGFDFYKAK